MKRYTYTFIQIVAAGLLITIKVTSFAFLFPFILVLLVPFRKWCLPWVFTERELTEVSERASSSKSRRHSLSSSSTATTNMEVSSTTSSTSTVKFICLSNVAT